MLFDPAAGKVRQGGAELINSWEQNPERLAWTDFVHNAKDHERTILQDRFGVHPSAVQDAQRELYPPKLEAFDDYLFLLFKALRGHPDDYEFRMIQLAVFLGARRARRGQGPAVRDSSRWGLGSVSAANRSAVVLGDDYH